MKEKKEYRVQLNEYIDNGDGTTSDHIIREYKTWAISTKKAISNVQFRTGIYSYNSVKELPGDGVRKLYFTAYELTKEINKKRIENFKNINYCTCGYCGYNNARHRLEYFKTCLKCGKPLGNKKYFKKKLLEKMEEE